jgi:hypothetical protein
MATRSFLVPEDRLREIFNYLPDVSVASGNFTPVFKVGDDAELIAFFKQAESLSKYPLLWLMQPFEEEHNFNLTKVDVDLSFILAVETAPDLLHSERLEKTFKPVLLPFANNVVEILRVSNTTSFSNPKVRITKFTNQSIAEELGVVGDQARFIDLWDAIQLKLSLTINDNCLREPKI